MSKLGFLSEHDVRRGIPDSPSVSKENGKEEVRAVRVNLQEERKRLAALKYKDAVALYASTDMTIRAIAKQFGFTACGLQAYICRHHRVLMLARYNISTEGKDPHSIKIQPPKGPSPAAYHKYKDAVEACGSLDYIEYNVSQVARQFGVDGTGLINFLKTHYPDIPVWREKVRRWMGIADNTPRGSLCMEQYAKAVELYRTTEYTIPEVAEICQVSLSGLSQHLRFYHHDVIAERERIRKKPGKRKRGERVKNGQIHEPDPDIEKKYTEALALYRDTPMLLKDIVAKTGVPMGGFRSYLRKWHRNLVLERSGIEETDKDVDLRVTRLRIKTTAAKYTIAIAKLKAGGCSMQSVAKEYGFKPDTFRDYLHKHEPELAEKLGMTRNKEGKRVSNQSEEKYAEAIRLYETTAEPLKSIARRLGLVYNSLGGYIRRNYPGVMRRHEELVKEQEQKTNKKNE